MLTLLPYLLSFSTIAFFHIMKKAEIATDH